MFLRFTLLSVLFAACTGGQRQKSVETNTPSVSVQLSSSSDNQLAKADTPYSEAPSLRSMKKPSGIYRFTMPYNNKWKIQHTVQFTGAEFQLQEKYIGDKSDSIVISRGIWAPSDGYIWTYKDQLVRGRYKWQGETLVYFSPRLKKLFPMEKLPSAMNNKPVSEKRANGSRLYGVGTEPFWNIEANATDSISFMTADWKQPLKVKITNMMISGDSTIYHAIYDSVELRILSLPYFCSDGMSDFIYPNKILVQYNGKQYSGCGVLFRQ